MPPRPQQARSRLALERFLATGEQLLAQDRFESTGVAEIAQLAESSVGTFYRLVGDKDQLLRRIHDDFIANSSALIEERLDPEQHRGASLASVLSTFVSLLVEIYLDREGLLRALIVRSSADPAFRQRIHALNHHIAGCLDVLVQPRMSQIGHPRPEPALRFGINVVLGALNHHTLVHSLASRSPELLTTELTRILTAYLDLEGS